VTAIISLILNNRPIVGLAIRLATRLVANYIVSVVGVIGYTKVLRAVLILLIAWFKEFLAFI
jgi:hypothetical protein